MPIHTKLARKKLKGRIKEHFAEREKFRLSARISEKNIKIKERAAFFKEKEILKIKAAKQKARDLFGTTKKTSKKTSKEGLKLGLSSAGQALFGGPSALTTTVRRTVRKRKTTSTKRKKKKVSKCNRKNPSNLGLKNGARARRLF